MRSFVSDIYTHVFVSDISDKYVCHLAGRRARGHSAVYYATIGPYVITADEATVMSENEEMT